MKIKLYSDIFPGLRPENLVFSQFPTQKTDSVKRIEITVDIPDYFFTDVIDASIQAEYVKEVKENKDDKDG